MLCELSIKNFAIIDDLRILFSSGLTILSGETGAGKSVIINAVNLLLGSRASSALIRSGCEMAELEAAFAVPSGSRTERSMMEMGFDTADGLILQRQILTSNRNKVYINGRMATMQMLQALTENLAGISGQHAHQGLLKEEAHLSMLDEFGGLMPLRTSVSREFRELLPLMERRKTLDLLQKKRSEQIDLLQFQRNEILTAALSPDEDTRLEQELIRLKNNAVLVQSAYDCISGLYDANGSVYEGLTASRRHLEKILKLDPCMEKTAELLDTAVFQIEDAVGSLRNYLKQLRTDPRQLEKVEERLDLLRRLKRKYGGTLSAVQERLEKIELELSDMESLSDQIRQTDAALKTAHNQLAALAMELSEKRNEAACRLSEKVQQELAELMMPNTRFSIRMGSSLSQHPENAYLSVQGKTISETGIDNACFMIAPNLGEAEKPLAEIASGGELSRVVLALKAIAAKTGSVETLVFDEVDAGIGGEAAEIVGKKLSSLARFHQVICITHLAQIAKFGEHHFKISKQVRNNRTQTMITSITAGERVEEIARMLGGKSITPTTLAHAQEMLNRT